MRNHYSPSRPVLQAVLAEDECVTVDRLREIAKDHGRTCQSLNGLFGTTTPSMVSRGSMRCLTDAGRERAQKP